MAILEKLRNYLDANGVEYVHHAHPTAFAARDVAAVENLRAHAMAKTVVYLGDNGFGMAVLPADALVDLQELRTLLGLTRLRLATEEELSELFPGCELGAMPPFGNLDSMPVFVESGLASEERIAFNAGTHRDVIYMAYKDFENLVKPGKLHFTRAMRA